MPINNYIASVIMDCFLPNCPKSILFGVFDGHGGSPVSKKLPGLISNVNNLINSSS